MIVEPLKGKRIEIKTNDPYDDYVVFYSVKGKGFTEKDIKSAVEWLKMYLKVETIAEEKHISRCPYCYHLLTNMKILIDEAFEDVINK